MIGGIVFCLPVCVVGRPIRLYYVADQSFPEIGRGVSDPQARNAQ